MVEKIKYIEFWHPMWFTHLPLARKFHNKIPNGTTAPSLYPPVMGGGSASASGVMAAAAAVTAAAALMHS